MLVGLVISSVWMGQAEGRASESCDWQTRQGCCDPATGQNCKPCPTPFAIVGARQTGHLDILGGRGGTPRGTAVIEVKVGWAGSVSHPLNGTPGWSDRSIFLETAGVHEIKVQSPPPGAEEIINSQQPKVHNYQLTFQPNPQGANDAQHCAAADGTFIWPSEQTYTATTSITWTPLPFGCSDTLPFEIPCHARTVTLSIAKDVFSGKIAEPAGGTRCSSTGAGQDIVVEIQKAIGCGTCFRTVAKVPARAGVFSQRFDLSNSKFKVLRKGTFAAFVDDSDSGSYACGGARSDPVKKT